MCTSTESGREPKEEATATTEQASSDVSERPVNPLRSASFLSRLFFLWPYPLLQLGMQRPLEEKDLAQVQEEDNSTYNRDYFNRIWTNEQRQHPDNPSLHRAIAKDFFKSTWYVQPMMCLGAAAKVTQALALGALVDSFGGFNDRGYLWASVLVICGLVTLFEHHHVFYFNWHKGMQLRIACIAAIYDKSLRLSSTHGDTTNSYGKIMNLASNDVERFLLAALFVSHLIWAPLQSIAILIVGCLLLGAAFATGFALLVLVFVPLQFYYGGRFAYYRSKIAAITDKRVTITSQAVRGARVMKMSGYEWRFLERIQWYRDAEIQQILHANNLKAWNEALFFFTNVVISLVIFLVHVFMGGTLTPGDVFTVFTLINILQLEMTKHVSLGVMGVSECYVSIGRIQKFLDFPELPWTPDAKLLEQSSGAADNDAVVSMSNVTSYWNEVDDTTKPKGDDTSLESDSSILFRAIDNVSLDFRSGELTAIVGVVGSGKSALLQTIVKELPVSSGDIQRPQPTAYAAQDPWIMDGTVRENILMGRPFDQEWYDQVIQACSLVVDFQQLRDGDQTIVGDRGVQCSGGQRARISMARAVYRDADVLVMDDPLSAVDAKVGRQLFQEAIQKLMVDRGKCVILATHQHQYLSESRCVLMVDGHVGCVGSYDECVAASDGKLHAHESDDTVDSLTEDTASSLVPARVADQEIVEDDPNAVSDSDKEDQAEMNVQGLVSLSTYANYLKAMGGFWVGVFLMIIFSVTQSTVLVTITAVGRWAERPPDEQDDWDMIGLVIGLGCAIIVFSIIRAYSSFQLTIKASQRLHDRMTVSVLRAKVEFFDTNPLGRIMNRFSADVGSNDDLLPQTLFDFSVLLFIVLGALIMTVITLPFVLLVFPPLMWYFLSVRKIFVTSTRELKRLEGLARSPIFAMLSESLGGIATIRANDALEYFKNKFQQAHDAHSRAFFAFIASSRWVGFRMDSIMFLFLVLVSYLSVLFNDQGWFNVDASILGLSLSMLLQLAGLFQWCIRQSAEVVNQMVSVERVLAFGDLEPEAPLEKDGDAALLDQGWPSQGAIDVQDLSVRYRENLPLALAKASFRIPAGARVGVVGRTGSGKSTLVQSLFRLLEPEEGCISIDGVDIANLGLHALRTRMSVIPQHPTLFSGCSVRENIDLFNLHSDDEIRKVLEDCHLASVVNALPRGWDSPVSEGGTNFSVGQRQLLCLARAILSQNKILILDEATASVDRRTDQLLQQTIQQTFHNGTILAVAHRLETVIESDVILVLGNAGKVLEFGPPAELLQSGEEKEEEDAVAVTGHFARMVSDTGEDMARSLRQRAFAKSARDNKEDN